jgi:hypothetical protein
LDQEETNWISKNIDILQKVYFASGGVAVGVQMSEQEKKDNTGTKYKEIWVMRHD